jgi:hypothetical protein
MKRPSVDSHPLEAHFPDGGHVIVTFRGDADRLSAECDELIQTLLRADGSESEIVRAIRACAEDLGLKVTSTGQHPTVITVARRAYSA